MRSLPGFLSLFGKTVVLFELEVAGVWVYVTPIPDILQLMRIYSSTVRLRPGLAGALAARGFSAAAMVHGSLSQVDTLVLLQRGDL